MGGLFYWAAGADRTLLEGGVERARYVGFGLAVLLTTMFAFVDSFLVMSLVVHGWHWWFVPVALLIAVAIFNFDRMLVSGVDYGDFTGSGVRRRLPWLRKGMGYASRILLSVLLALVIAEPVILTFFGPEVGEQLAVIHDEAAARASADIRSGHQFADLKATYDTTLADARADAAAKKADAKAKQDAADLEASGRGGSFKIGCAKICVAKQQAADEAQGAYEAALTKADNAQVAHDNLLKGLEPRIDAAIAARKQKIYADNGLLTREKALNRATAKNPDLWAWRIAITGLLLLIDLGPVLVKISSNTVHDHKARKLAALFATDYEATLVHERDVRDRGRTDRDRDIDHEEKKRQLARDADLQIETVRQQLHRDLWLHRLHTQHQQNMAMPVTLGMSAPAAAPAAPAAAFGMTAQAPAPAPPVPPQAGTAKQGPPDVVLVGAKGHRWVVSPLPPPWAAGGQSDTALAHREGDPGDQVVVKRTKWDKVQNTNGFRKAVAQMEKELVRHDSVVSPHVAPVVDHGFEPAYGTFIITRRYPMTLAKRIADMHDQQNPWIPTLQWALRITGEVMHALDDCLNQAAIVHLDIKPANIALDPAGQVNLIDFGLAKIAPGLSAGASSGGIGYTLFYAPPEQIRRRPERSWWTPRCDIRAAGATLYELLTGWPPMWTEAQQHGLIDMLGRFNYVRTPEFLQLAVDVGPARPGKLLPGLPSAVDDLVMRWLSPRPADRPGDPAEARRELSSIQNALENTPEEYMPIGPTTVIGSPGPTGGASGTANTWPGPMTGGTP